MKESKTKLTFITPTNLGSREGIKAWFTLKNDHHCFTESKIEGLNLGFNTRETSSIIEQNRNLLLSELSLKPEWVAYGIQVHSNRVKAVSQGGTYGSTDGFVTTTPGLTLAIQVADCAAILLWDSQNHVVGALHAGWRGAVGDIVSMGLKKMKRQGACTEQMNAFISPCLSLANFEVGQEVAEQFPRQFVDRKTYDKPHVDLKGFLNHQLVEEGLNPSDIEMSQACTVEKEKYFYSYRREGEQSGRMMALIQIQR